MAVLEDYKCSCGRCEIRSSNPKFVASGKKTKFILVNKGKKIIDKRIVDDCLLKMNVRIEKCDYLLDIRMDKIAYFIECKGSDILKAVDQIDSTLNILRDLFSGYTLKGRIIPTRVYSPDLISIKFKKLLKKLNGDLIVKSINITETI